MQIFKPLCRTHSCSFTSSMWSLSQFAHIILAFELFLRLRRILFDRPRDVSYLPPLQFRCRVADRGDVS